jgi:hypothetical protein
MSFSFSNTYGKVSLDPGSHGEFNGTWLSFKSREGVEMPPCAFTPGELRLLRAGIDRRLEQIEREDE